MDIDDEDENSLFNRFCDIKFRHKIVLNQYIEICDVNEELMEENKKLKEEYEYLKSLCHFDNKRHKQI